MARDFKSTDTKPVASEAKGSSSRGDRQKKGKSINIPFKPKALDDNSYAPHRSKGFNDPSWYASNPQLLKDAASYAFSNFQGMEITPTGNGIGAGAGYSFKPAGTCALMYVPTFGKCSSPVDALNIAVRNIYSFVRHANSGHTNYEPADLGIYLFSIVEIYGMIAFLERMYGVSRVYSTKNRNMPKQLLGAMFADDASILANQAQFRFDINRLIQKVASLCIPKGFPLLERRVWMNSFIFKDADTEKAGQYMFVPMGYYKYEPTKLSTGGILEFNYWTALNQSYSVYISDIESCIDAVLQDEDMNIMSGDILKAYGDGGLAKLGYLPEDYNVVPVFQPEVLPQIHNADIIGTWDADAPTSVHYKAPGTIDYSNCGPLFVQQVDGILMNEIYLSDGSGYYYNSSSNVQIPYGRAIANSHTYKYITGTVLLDLPSDTAEPSDVMVATRLKAALRPGSVNSRETCEVAEFGTELLVGAYTLEAKVYNLTNAIVIPSNNIYPTVSGGNVVAPDYLKYIRAFAQFNKAPLCYITDLVDASASVDMREWAFKHVLGDIYNFTTIKQSDLHKLHTVAVLSELSLPGTLFGNK